MNTQIQAKSPAQTNGAVSLTTRRDRPARDFGTGYGRSSGYASPRRYVNDWGLTRFRCA